MAGLPTRAGSDVLADAPPATADAPVVARLRRGRRGRGGQAAHPRVRLRPDRRRRRHRAGPQPARPDPDHRRLVVRARPPRSPPGTCRWRWAPTPAPACAPRRRCAGWSGSSRRSARCPPTGVFPLSETCDHVGLLAADVHGAAVAWDVLRRPDGTGGGSRPPASTGVRVGVLLDDVLAGRRPGARPRPSRPRSSALAARRRARRRAAHADDRRAGRHLPARSSGRRPTRRTPRWLAERPQDYQPVTRERLLPLAEQPARALRRRRSATRRRLVAALRAAVGRASTCWCCPPPGCGPPRSARARWTIGGRDGAGADRRCSRSPCRST